MIARPGPSLSASAAARRAAAGRLPCWLTSPGDADVESEREVVACDPVLVLRGSTADELERAWDEQRRGWSGAPDNVPIAVGYLGYDLGRTFERLRGRAPASSGWPLLEVRFYAAVWVREARTGAATIWARDERAAQALGARLAGPEVPVARAVGLGPLAALDGDTSYLAAVRRILEYVRAGDAYQVNLARRLVAPIDVDPGAPGLALFARLQADAPAPHALWFPGADGEALVGNSPERFLRVTSARRVETRPIKGTRPRAAAAESLARSEKDRAEHTMIVDLERNDLGRVCLPGSVRVASFARLVSLPTVHHLVSTVDGQLRPDVGLADLLRATFPGGSITGAPKIRAMEIIDELEPACRGPYTGATGWLGAAGDLDLAIAIRTAAIRDDVLTLWVGGGIVADSLPEDELAETVAKAEAFARLARAGGR